jgi:LAS superfamily LD-carboxypeptidase LdcB
MKFFGFQFDKNVAVYVEGAISLVLVAGLVAAGVYQYRQYKGLELSYLGTLEDLEYARKENAGLLLNLRDEQYARENIEKQLGNLGSTLGTLEKLSQTDEELLKKYSKVYFLNENYSPARLSDINLKFVYPEKTELQIHSDVKPYLDRLLESASSDGIDLRVASAFRSYDRQASLKEGYKFIYGSGANQFSADQGYSEHQLGTTLDFTTSTVGGIFSSFESDKAYKWLLANAHNYGFVLSYPKGNVFYKFEPWHWRFVGVELATKLHNEGKYFYDLDQREIDTYLVKLFD